MKKIFYFLILLIFSRLSFTQIVVTEPEFPTENDSIIVYFDATRPGAEELLNYNDTVYAHTGVNTNLGNWQHVIGTWGINQTQPALVRLGDNLYQLTIGYPRLFYSVTNPSEKIQELAFVFRSEDGDLQTRPDIFIPVYGLIAAAVNTLIAYVLFYYITQLVSDKYIKIPYENTKLVTMIVIGSVLSATIYFLPDINFVASFIIKIVLVGIFPLILYLFRFYEKAELDVLLSPKKLFGFIKGVLTQTPARQTDSRELIQE